MGRDTEFNFGANAEPDYAAHDPPTYVQACMGMLVCPHCGAAAICGDVAAALGSKMLPATSDPAQPEGDTHMDLASHRPKDRKGGGKYTRRDFLKASHIPAKGGLKCKVIDFRTAPKQMEFSDFLMDVSAGKKEYTVGIRSGSVLLDMICEELGTKTERYPGKTITFVRGGNKGQYINVG